LISKTSDLKTTLQSKLNIMQSRWWLAAFLLLMTALVIYYFAALQPAKSTPREALPSYQSIAVLPFQSAATDEQYAYLGDGLTEGVLHSLGRYKDIRISSKGSSFEFRDSLDVLVAGRKLGVRTVLTGTLRLDRDRLHVASKLIDVEMGSNIWNRDFDEPIENMFTIQDRIADAVATELKISMLHEYTLKANKPLVNQRAYELYLRGRRAWNLRNAAALKEGVKFFHEAIDLAPDYAEAYAGLADCYNALGYGSFVAPNESFPKAKDAALKAIELNPGIAEPRAALGFYRFYFEWDWAAAEEEFRMAIGLNPNYDLGYIWYAYFLTAMKRYDEAEVILRKAKELDPLSAATNTDLGFCLYYSANYDSALSCLNATIKNRPTFGPAHLWAGRAYQAKKMYPEAISEFKATLKYAPGWPVALAALGSAYGAMGEAAAAQHLLDTLTTIKKTRFVTAYGVALIYSGLGRKDDAFKTLDAAYNEHSHWLVWLRTDPRWAAIRDDPRFEQLVKRVGLPR
jgi:TolB-like protein